MKSNEVPHPLQEPQRVDHLLSVQRFTPLLKLG